MLELGWFSVKLFLKGLLLEDTGYFARQTAIGAAMGLLLLVGLAKLGIPLWLPVILTSLVTGAMMPFLLKDIRMK